MQPERTLRWEGCWNIRDLGGLPTEDGGETQFGRVVRAESLSTLEPAGWEELRSYGVSRIIDLRHETDDPYDAGDIDVVRVPLADPGTFAQLDGMLAGVDDAVEWRTRSYLYFLDAFGDRFGRAVSAVAGAPDGAVLVHCAGGVDRTGLVAALMLRVSGVAVHDVAADYALSEANWAPFSQAWIDAGETEEERRKRAFLSGIPALVMNRTLTDLEREHGSVRDYLLSSGVESDSLERVRARLRG